MIDAPYGHDCFLLEEARQTPMIQEFLARDVPEVYLWWPRQIEAVSSDLHGFKPNGIIENWNSWEWSL